ncbi:WD repeat-containing protein [Salix suchowensis]|nr:WD repeat-containing protein [Salix suchowensis]
MAPSTSFEDSAGAEANKCRVVVFEIQPTERSGSFDAAFVKLGDWIENGTTHVDVADNLGKSIRVVENYELKPTTPELTVSDGDTRLNLPNPFKALRSRSTEHLIRENTNPMGDVSSCTKTFELGAGNVNTVYTESASGLLDAKWVDHESYVLIFNTVPASLHPLPPFQKAFSLSRTDLLVYTNETVKGVRLQVISAHSTSATTIWQPSPSTTPSKVETYLTATLPLDQESVILGYSTSHSNGREHPMNSSPTGEASFDKPLGRICQGNLRKKASTKYPTCPSMDTSLHFSSFTIAELNSVSLLAELTTGHLQFGHQSESLPSAVSSSLKLCARWTIFTTSLLNVLQFPDDRGVLGGCILCVAEDGTIAVVVVDGFSCAFLYMIPGAPATLERLCLREDNLLLYYANHMVRLWDVKTKEFWRSMVAGKADELMQEGGWAQL